MARITRREFIKKAGAAAVGCGDNDNDGNDNVGSGPPQDFEEVLDSFDYLVVLMLKNRSFDNLLGFLYPNGVPANAPAGTTFDGVTGKNLSNPILVLRVEWTLAVWSVAARELLDVVRDEAVTF
jgi:phospholipase C